MKKPYRLWSESILGRILRDAGDDEVQVAIRLTGVQRAHDRHRSKHRRRR